MCVCGGENGGARCDKGEGGGCAIIVVGGCRRLQSLAGAAGSRTNSSSKYLVQGRASKDSERVGVGVIIFDTHTYIYMGDVLMRTRTQRFDGRKIFKGRGGVGLHFDGIKSPTRSNPVPFKPRQEGEEESVRLGGYCSSAQCI